jgi:hypothetical protein
MKLSSNQQIEVKIRKLVMKYPRIELTDHMTLGQHYSKQGVCHSLAIYIKKYLKAKKIMKTQLFQYAKI